MDGPIRVLGDGQVDPGFYNSDDYNSRLDGLKIRQEFEVPAAKQQLRHVNDVNDYFQPQEPTGEVSVSSHYWKIPDKRQYLTAIATHETDPLVAIASGSRESNLFIYELDKNELDASKSILTHHQTITLAEIHSLAWASPNDPLGQQGNVIFTGHNTGMVHMILLPDPYRSSDPAEIMKRFNHNRHVEGATSTRISQLGLTSGSWTCSAPTSIMSLFNEHLFLWDPSRSDMPIMKKKIRGVSCFDISTLHDGVISVGSSKGISIRDVRAKGSHGLSPPTGNDKKVTQVKWSPFDANIVAAVHDGNTLKVWDVRANAPMLTYHGHSDIINSINWSNTDSNQLWSASDDNTIRMWDIDESQEQQRQVDSISNSVQSVRNNEKDAKWVPTKPWKLYRQRLSRYNESFSLGYFVDPSQGGTLSSTTIFSESKQFLSLASFPNTRHGDQSILSIDNDGFFGLHVKENSNAGSRRGSFGYSDSMDSSDSDIGSSYSVPTV
ncbi:Dse1p [Sugiyamaella lignohabitans]|uniref:Dse1p n=1 Tax=Sugiyamaella lignohabitans TaxID=796027 RepID=A0A167CQ95_9ASCO|nr:Dse1p [Sugiyamaella lignohabitans]ANB11975.1 Dse1p [Sugiyamaella lignohabitans]